MCGGVVQTVFIAFTLLCCAELASGAQIGEERGDSVAVSQQAVPSHDDADADNETVDDPKDADTDVDDAELDDIIAKAAQSGAQKAGADPADSPNISKTADDRKSSKQKSKDKAMKAMGLDRPKKSHKKECTGLDKCTVLESQIEKAVAAALEDVRECKKFENRKAVSEGARPGSAAASELPSAKQLAEAAGEAAANVARKANLSEKVVDDEYQKAFTAAEESAKLEKIVKDATPVMQKAQANAATARMKLLKAKSQAARADAKEKMANAQLVNLEVQEASDCMEARMVQVRARDAADVEAGEAVAVDPEILAFNKELETSVSKGLAKALLAGKSKEEAAKIGGRAVATIAAAAKTSPDEAARIAAAAASDIGFPEDAVVVCGGAAAEAVALKSGKTEEEAKKIGEGAAKTVKDAQDDDCGCSKGECDDDAVETTSETSDEKNETSEASDEALSPTEE